MAKGQRSMRPEVARITKIRPESLGAVLRYVLPLLDEPCPPCSGTGVVVVAGGKYLAQAYASIRKLREVSDLPVQIWHLGPKEVNDAQREVFRDLDVEFVDAYEVRKQHPMHRLGGWECKSFAVAYCPFERVLMLDADAWPMFDPESVFASPHFFTTGCLMWPDIQACRPNDGIFSAMAVKKPSDFWETEVGQLFIDKKRMWPSVRLTVFLNSHSEATYKFLFGDKDLWQLSMMKMKQPFKVGDKPDWKGWGMIHKLNGVPVVTHAMNTKRHVSGGPQDWLDYIDQFSELQLQPA